MSMGIASLVCVALLVVAFPHLLWGIGRKWPVRDEALLARTVIGTAGVSHMPPWYRSLGIGVLSFAAAWFVLALADHDAGAATMSAIGALMAVIFLARGIAGYLPAWRRQRPEEPFRQFDPRFYSPLCLVIGLGFALLVLMRLM